MMNLSLINILLFMGLTWGTNIALNLLYVLKRYLPGFKSWDRPLDGKINFFDSKRLFGESTTVLGLVVALFCSLLAFYSGIFGTVVAISTPFLVYVGHTLGSFIKRRMKHSDGFVPFVDHGDYVFVSGLVLSIGGYLSLLLAVVCLLLTYILHPLAALIAFKMKLREKSY